MAAVPALAPAAVAAAPAPRPAAPINTVRVVSRSRQVRELAASGKPEDAFRAYGILSECLWARQELKNARDTRAPERSEAMALRLDSGALAEQATRACDGLTDADFGQRLALAERAAEAGVPMAALRLAQEGPFGDFSNLATRPDDPLVLEWRRHMVDLIRLAAERGDVASLMSLSQQYRTGNGLVDEPNAKLALQYGVAQFIVYQAQNGKGLPGQRAILGQLTGGLSAEDAAQARREGERIAAVALKGGTQ